MNGTFALIGGVASILGFFVGIASTKWGRGVITDVGRSLRVPFLGVKMVRAGIYDFFDSRTSLSKKRGSTKIIDYLSMAEEEIGIIALSLNYSIMHQHLHEDLRTLIKQKPALNVSIYLLNPKSSLLNSIANTSGRTSDELKDYIFQSLSRLEEIRSTLDESEEKRFCIYLYDTYIANSILILDPHKSKGKFLVENYLYKVPIHGRYSFECKRADSSMYSKLLIAYEEFKKDFSECITSACTTDQSPPAAPSGR